jgi:hypothetical protein
MRDFFKPWRRKAGVLTLGLACLAMVGWVRSQTNLDALFRLNKTNTHELSSYDGSIHWDRIWPIVTPRPSRWVYRHNGNITHVDNPWEGCKIHWKVEGFGFALSAFSRQELVVGLAPPTEFEQWSVPYWSIAIPLTLLSAWLLLSKSRQKPTTEPAPTTDPDHA